MSNKNNKINNPLSGIPTKSLILTLVMILLCIACGFGFGYCARGFDDDQRENQAVTAYADASSFSDNDYTVVSFSTPAFSNSNYYLVSPKITLLNHSLSVYPNGQLIPLVFSTLTPVIDSSSQSLNFVDNNRLGVSLSYSALIEPSDNPAFISFGLEALNLSDYTVSPLICNVNAVLSGSLIGDWELLRVEGFYFVLDPSSVVPFVGLRAVYSNGATIVFSISWSSASLDVFASWVNVNSSFVFYNTSETGLTAEAYERGKLAGMADLEDQIREARLEGYNNGLTEGEEIGYQRGLDTSLEDISPFNVIVSGVNSFLRTEILPGVQLTIILSVAFGILLLGFSIKIFLGG